MRDIQLLFHARGDEGSPGPEDGDLFYARPDAAEKEEAINKFISSLESQEHEVWLWTKYMPVHTASVHCIYVYVLVYTMLGLKLWFLERI